MFSLSLALRQVLASSAGSSARSALSSLSLDGVHQTLSQRAMSSSSGSDANEAGPSGSPPTSAAPESPPQPSAETSTPPGPDTDPAEAPSAPSGLRKLSEVLGHNIKIQPLPQKVASPSSALEEELGKEVPEDDLSEGSEEEDPAQQYIDPKYGFSVIGGIIPEAEGSETSYSVHPRVHPSRTFLPGQAYNPQDLNPYSTQEDGPSRFSGRRERRMPSVSEARAFADYKNVQFLEKYLSPAGRMLPRRETKLPVTLHVHVMRQIKLARTMGLIAGEARLDKLHVRKMRELGITSLEQLAQQAEAAKAVAAKAEAAKAEA